MTEPLMRMAEAMRDEMIRQARQDHPNAVAAGKPPATIVVHTAPVEFDLEQVARAALRAFRA